MIGTIIPMVYGAPGQKRKSTNAVGHLVGAVFGASLLGAVLGSIGLVLSGVGPAFIGWLAVALVSLIYAAHELALVRLPVPEFHRQVPAAWRSSFSPRTAAGIYGLVLGAGVFTHITTATFYVACLSAVVLGDPILGATVLGAFGLGRGLPILLLVAGSRDMADAFWKYDRLAFTGVKWIHQANGQALALVGVYLLARSLP